MPEIGAVSLKSTRNIMKRPLGMIRVSAGFLPREPSHCPQDSCVYNAKGVCDDPRTNRGNSDAACHKQRVAKLLDSLSEIGGRNGH